jgi:hypothetical protein
MASLVELSQHVSCLLSLALFLINSKEKEMDKLIEGIIRVITPFRPFRRWLSKRLASLIIDKIGDETGGFGIKQDISKQIVKLIKNAIKDALKQTNMSVADKHYIVEFVGDIVLDYMMNEMRFDDLWKMVKASMSKKRRDIKSRNRFKALLAPVIFEILSDKQVIKIMSKQIAQLIKKEKGSGIGTTTVAKALSTFLDMLGLKPTDNEKSRFLHLFDDI